MKHDDKRSRAAFWATVAMVVLLVAYPLSFGPACWIVSRRPGAVNFRWLPDSYWPIGWCAKRSDPVRNAIWRFGQLGMKDDSDILVPNGSSWGM
jgi:hypothetical protein